MPGLFHALAMLVGILTATFALVPFLLRRLGRAIGSHIRDSTQQRRQILLARAAAEEKEHTLDEEWEKVKTDDGPHTPPQPSGTSDAHVGADHHFSGVVAFFHPFCNAGGGGERVLFAAIEATQQRYPSALCVVYTGDHDASKAQILTNVRHRFNIHLRPARVAFLYLSTRPWILASQWPRFTLLGQSLGSLLVAWDAFHLLPPDIFIDTMGYAFTLALSNFLFPAVPTAAYVHYPTISTDMLRSLHSSGDTSQGLHAGLGTGLRGKAKQYYWDLFARLYSWVGGHVDVVMTNSTWTQRHVQSLWRTSRTQRGKSHPIEVVYPPCAVGELQDKIPVTRETESQRTRNILYIAQFRPEKMHGTILDAFAAFLKSQHQTPNQPTPKLILVGSVRDDQDEKRVYMLRLQAQEMKEHVEFVVNAGWPQILEFLRTSSVGVNGMWNEHFGIGVVEYQAAGLISVVNDSGGPKEDIVIPIDGERTGFHATTPSDFAEAFASALALSPADAHAMRLRARQSSWRFSEAVFARAWLRQMEALVGMAG
ncbi:hypothetical protein B0A50_05760 [Salinomyces thailandicus]|uniref:GDP-Man:Man(3)GlcNAc(2)-PP-Dol alpha-1,2-mannosyltransferase n=1 Tax=Salinomyces thailandicus TaxID=706561 RepID=A0A4U0TSA1_9PEZI|nr:hypothetical protein B0A50_05760 [Salinomyces thailandica]